MNCMGPAAPAEFVPEWTPGAFDWPWLGSALPVPASTAQSRPEQGEPDALDRSREGAGVQATRPGRVVDGVVCGGAHALRGFAGRWGVGVDGEYFVAVAAVGAELDVVVVAAINGRCGCGDRWMAGASRRCTGRECGG